MKKKNAKISKGVLKQKVSRQFNYKKYEEALSRELNGIRQTKLALSNYDGKRYWLSDCESLPYGDCLIASSMIG